jgi:hypothetical protein
MANSSRKRPETQKWWVFCHSSLKCTDCRIPCKCPRNPKTIGNSSRKWP